MFFLLSPERERARMLARARYATSPENIRDFGDIKRPRQRRDVGIRASSFLPANPMNACAAFVGAGIDELITNKTNDLRYVRRTLPFGNGLPIVAASDLWGEDGRAFFDADIAIPTFQISKQGAGQFETWMSLTPHELWTLRPGIQAATGHVVLAGLGMGWMLNEIVKKPSVLSVTVVEKNESLMKWFGDELCRLTPKVTKVICGDIYETLDRFDFKQHKFIMDIWQGYRDAEGDRRLAEMRVRGARVWAWGASGRSATENWLMKESRDLLGLL